MTRKINILKILIFFSYLAPVFTFILYLNFKRDYGFTFCCFILLHASLRIWETFFTSKEKDRLNITDDWTLILVTFVYILLCYLYIAEFYLAARKINLSLSLLGVLIYLIAFRVRWWGMAALGKQWAINAVGEKKIAQVRLVKIGPFKYIRHPIYLATVIEQLGVLFIANAYYSMAYFWVIILPCYFIRMKEEEKSNILKFGEEYIKYTRSTGMLVPKLHKS